MMRKKEKGANSVIALQNFTKIYDSNIMTLAQAVLEIFCSQVSIGLK